MSKQQGFYFLPKKWLGDADVIAMDWDCKGMHLHLMAIAWQQDPKGYILDDENLIRKLLGNPELEDWNNRIKPQIFKAWKQAILKIDGIERKYWLQPGVLKTATAQNTSNESIVSTKKTRVKKTKAPLMEFDNPDLVGFNLSEILQSKPTTTILHEKSSKEEKNNIWHVGVEILTRNGDSEQKARGFLARLIKQYGDKEVATALAQMSLSSISPAEIHAYLVGILKKQQDPQKKRTGRGSVSL